MPRKKKEIEVVKETPKTKKSAKKYPKDDGPLTESQLEQLQPRPLVQFEIDWDKIAENVREAALSIEQEPLKKQTRKKTV